ncbi:hypothetical protein Isop_0619 [Isosphaera pallida ATCC 43644]|uniref:Uncharacterized protein n=1 Tax=Isosphaera pallida (strain ATCC 43644 / DSM 9630 / IS1B) TaxID=575540 RepID=E8R0M6_ISOPI|nr:hypothetical protein Isop_0619 [Isosphaera pallida ATCC 43644]
MSLKEPLLFLRHLLGSETMTLFSLDFPKPNACRQERFA